MFECLILCSCLFTSLYLFIQSALFIFKLIILFQIIYTLTFIHLHVYSHAHFYICASIHVLMFIDCTFIQKNFICSFSFISSCLRYYQVHFDPRDRCPRRGPRSLFHSPPHPHFCTSTAGLEHEPDR